MTARRRARTEVIRPMTVFRPGPIWGPRPVRFTGAYRVNFIGGGAPVLIVSERGQSWHGIAPSTRRAWDARS